MQKNKWVKHIKAFALMIIIIIAGIYALYFVQMQYHKAKLNTIKTNMTNIELKTKEYIDKQKAAGKEVEYIGTKVSEFSEIDQIKDFLEKCSIPEEEYEKYFVLSDEDLSSLNLKFGNEGTSYFIVNYESVDVYITTGYKVNNDLILYKLSDIIKIDEPEQNNENSEEVVEDNTETESEQESSESSGEDN